MLLNLTNHPSARWGDEQMRSAVKCWGSVVDLPFPDVPPGYGDAQVAQYAVEVAKKAVALHPDAVLCQGEMTMAFALVQILHMHGIPSYAATSRRETVESVKDGIAQKQSVFRFERFRKYTVMDENKQGG